MLKSIFLNRFTVTLGAILVIALVWNIYVSANNDGIIRGLVVDTQGNPVAGATVLVSGNALALSQTVGEVTTNQEGRFNFKGHDEYSISLKASLDSRVSENRNIRLWFKSQNFDVAEAIILPD